MYRTEEGVLETKGLRMDYIAFGRGTKPLVMVQGLNTRGIKGAGVSLAWMYRIFAKEYRVYLFDRRENIPDRITVRELADDLAAAMDEMKIKKADILGVSQGGMIAQYLAADRPDLVRKMVLAVTLSQSNDTVASVIGNWIKLTEQGNMKELVTDMAEKMYSESYLKRYRPFLPLLTILQRPKDTKRFAALAEACLTCDAKELEKITCPVMVIGGKLDQIVGGWESEKIAEQLGCELYMYENLGHAAYEEAKDFNQRVYDFFKRCEG